MADICEICFKDEEEIAEGIKKCAKCGVPVHVTCYEIDNIFDNFVCTFCLHKKKNENKTCALCPVKNGVLVLTKENSFVHVTCVLFIGKAYFCDKKNMIADISMVPHSSFNKQVCVVCNMKKGVAIKCNSSKCKVYFHALCNTNGLEEEGDSFVSYCEKHRKHIPVSIGSVEFYFYITSNMNT